MKTRLSVLASLILPALAMGGATAPSAPTGTISVNTSLVRVGTSPIVSWNIIHPAPIIDVVDVDPDDNFTPKKQVKMDVRIIGADYRYDSRTYKPVRLEVRVAGGSWTRIFSGTQSSVKPDQIIYTRTVASGQKVEFRFQGAQDPNGGGWNPYRYGPDQMVVAMVQGQRPPAYAPYLSKNSVTSYLTPYLNDDGTMDLGPRDIIYLTELTNTDTDAAGFDLQDLVVMVTVTEQ